MRYAFLLIFTVLLSFVACQEETSALPKPRAYPRVVFPAGELQSFELQVCPFTFEYPSYIEVVRDTAFFDEKPKNPCWFDLVTPSLNGRIHMSYYPIQSLQGFEELRADAFDLVGKHNVVASYIDEQAIVSKAPNVNGFTFDIEGDVASPFQFYLTDSTQHFLRGSLYVRAKASSDSLRPIYQFMKQDILNSIKTLNWK